MKKRKRTSKRLLALATFLMASPSAMAVNWAADQGGTIKKAVVGAESPNQVEYDFGSNANFFMQSQAERPFRLGTVDGKTYTISAESGLLGSDRWKLGDDITRWGSYNITDPSGALTFASIRHGQYIVGAEADGSPSLGARFIPVRDDRTADGAKTMDKFLRDQMNLSDADKIFAPIIYFHPEFPGGSMEDFSGTHRLDDGFTHKGAYIGEGQTRNAPFGYHQQKWGMSGGYYPAHVVQVKYKGATSQAEFNKNAYVALRLLNETGSNVQFSRLDYEKDYMDGISLKNIFDFYRGWLDDTWIRSADDKYANGDPKPFFQIMMDDLKYDTYCAEHITMVINVALNLVQNEKGYVDLFGSNDQQQSLGAAAQFNGEKKGGEYFFKKAKEKWASEIGGEFPEVAEGSITPLFKMDGENKHPEAIPARGISKGDSINIGQAALIESVGFAMAWAPQTLADMISDVMALYGRFDIYDEAAAQDPAMVAGIPAKLLQGLFGAVQDRVKFTDTPNDLAAEQTKYNQLIQPIIEVMMEKAAGIVPGQAEANAAIYQEFRNDPRVQETMAKLNDVKAYNMSVEGNDFFYYTPPPTLNRILQGNHRHNKYVDFTILGTAMDEDKTVENTDASLESPNPTAQVTHPDQQGLASAPPAPADDSSNNADSEEEDSSSSPSVDDIAEDLKG